MQRLYTTRLHRVHVRSLHGPYFTAPHYGPFRPPHVWPHAEPERRGRGAATSSCASIGVTSRVAPVPTAAGTAAWLASGDDDGWMPLLPPAEATSSALGPITGMGANCGGLSDICTGRG